MILKTRLLIEKILISMLLLYTLRIPRFISFNLGIDFPVEEIFLVAPFLVLFYKALKNGVKKIPYIKTFLFLIIAFILNESRFFRPNIVPNYTYIDGVIKFYAIYLVLSLTDKKKILIPFVLKISILFISLFITYFYLAYFGIVSNKAVNVALTGRYYIGQAISINGVSFAATYAMFCIIVLNYIDKIKANMSLILLIYFLGIIIMHATRGAFYIAFALYAFFVANEFKKSSNAFKVIVIFSIIIAIIVSVSNYGKLENINILRRIVNNEGTGRETQAKATWINFKKNPLFGVGYTEAGISEALNTTRSNVHYTQILASNGIIYVFLFFLFIFKLLGYRKKNKISLLSSFMGLIAFSAYNWTLILPLAFVAYQVNKMNNYLKYKDERKL